MALVRFQMEAMNAATQLPIAGEMEQLHPFEPRPE
jgi:hypothetical protein